MFSPISQRSFILCHRNQVQRTHLSSYPYSHFVDHVIELFLVWTEDIDLLFRVILIVEMCRTQTSNRHFHQGRRPLFNTKVNTTTFMLPLSPNIYSYAEFNVYMHLFIRLLPLTARLLAVRIDMIQPHASIDTSSSAIFMLNL